MKCFKNERFQKLMKAAIQKVKRFPAWWKAHGFIVFIIKTVWNIGAVIAMSVTLISIISAAEKYGEVYAINHSDNDAWNAAFTKIDSPLFTFLIIFTMIWCFQKVISSCLMSTKLEKQSNTQKNNTKMLEWKNKSIETWNYWKWFQKVI